MRRFILFPEIEAEMIRRNETQQDIANLLKLDRTQVSRKLKGTIQWTIGDIEVLTNHYQKDFWELFRKNERRTNENNTKN